MEIRFTLVGDGPFDAALLPIIRWSLRQQGSVSAIAGEFANPSRLPPQAARLAARMRAAVELYPCNLLFVHRDAETQGRNQRLAEIRDAVAQIPTVQSAKVARCVPVIPIRMTEAWLLISEQAIRHASGNPNGRVALNLPSIHRLETRPDPKRELHEALRKASNLPGRRLARFDEKTAAKRVADYIIDYAPLRNLSAFRDYEADVSAALQELADHPQNAASHRSERKK